MHLDRGHPAGLQRRTRVSVAHAGAPTGSGQPAIGPCRPPLREARSHQGTDPPRHGRPAADRRPQVKAQQLKLEECKDLEGFEELSVAMLGVYDVHPVIGFQDGWMYIGSSAGAVKKVLDTKAGNGETMEGTEAFQKLKLDVEGSGRFHRVREHRRRTRGTWPRSSGQIGIMATDDHGMAGASRTRTT